MINQYTIYKFNHKYAEINVDDDYPWDSIQTDFAKFEAKLFDELNHATWKVVRYYCYRHRFEIDYNFGPSRSCTIVILQAVIAK